MEQVLQQIDDGIFTVRDLFSPGECQSLIARAEAVGFEAASVRTTGGPQMITSIRNNDRAELTDPGLAEVMWQRVRFLLPRLDSATPCGVDPHLRFYRYVPGQQFKRHKDGRVTNDAGQTSKLSYLIYLNDDCEGGATKFLEHRDIDGDREKIEFSVQPATGSALLFRHEKWHEGTPVTSGTKYVLRSDLFYATEQ